MNIWVILLLLVGCKTTPDDRPFYKLTEQNKNAMTREQECKAENPDNRYLFEKCIEAKEAPPLDQQSCPKGNLDASTGECL